MPEKMRVAFLSMEMLLRNFPEPHRGANFRGGLGILAGDIAANMSGAGIDSMCFVPLYNRPWFDKNRVLNNYESVAEPVLTVPVHTNGHEYAVKVWDIKWAGVYGLECPEVFNTLYAENRQKRLTQEVVFPMAVTKALRAKGFRPDVVWLNESHSAFVLPHLREDPYFENTATLFTIHTPEHAGMERYYDYKFETLGINAERYGPIFVKNHILDLTWGALLLSDAVNAVSAEHREVTRQMFNEFRTKISGIRNGTDLKFWTYPKLQEHIDSNGGCVNPDAILQIHGEAKEEALDTIARESGIRLNSDKPTAWFVRRLAQYKNLYPLLRDILPGICGERGEVVETPLGRLTGLGMQVVGAGMAPETDSTCLWWMEQFGHMATSTLRGRFVFLPKYSTNLLQMGAWGSDIWLVTPELKREACSTSDQRAAINGIPVLTSKTGGMLEYIEEFNPKTKTGNGFFLDPYDAITLYGKLSIFADLWYKWRLNGDQSYPALTLNAFSKRGTLDIRGTLEEYKSLFRKIT